MLILFWAIMLWTIPSILPTRHFHKLLFVGHFVLLTVFYPLAGKESRPTLCTIQELQNSKHDVPELHKIHRSPEIEAIKLWKGRSGRIFDYFKASISGYRRFRTTARPNISQFQSLIIRQTTSLSYFELANPRILGLRKCEMFSQESC